MTRMAINGIGRTGGLKAAAVNDLMENSFSVRLRGEA